MLTSSSRAQLSATACRSRDARIYSVKSLGARGRVKPSRRTTISVATSHSTDSQVENVDFIEQGRLVVAITGATGFVGSKLVELLLEGGAEVRVLTRDVARARARLSPSRLPRGDVAFVGPEKWRRGLIGATHVVNLAGEPISTRWDPRIKGEIMASRVKTTKTIVEHMHSIKDVDKRPKVLVNASAIGYYGTSETNTYDESSGPGQDYLSQVCQAWEQTALGVPGECRVVLLRLGIVLDRDGGALGKMVPTFQAFMGGPLGDGSQWFSWIHREDAVGLIMESLTNEDLEGAVNCVAPTPVRMREMCETLGETLGKPNWLPVPDFAIKSLLGEGATVVLNGQQAVSSAAICASLFCSCCCCF